MKITSMLKRCDAKLQMQRQAVPTAGPTATVPMTVAPAKAASAPVALAPGMLLAGKYRLLRPLGQGGMGTVYLAWDLYLKRAVAIKLLLPQRRACPHSRARFQAEAAAAGRVHHRNVLTIYDGAAPDFGPGYLVMKWAAGGSVEARLRAGGAFSPLQATRLTLGACRGLQAVHRAGLLHCDVKPANLLLTGRGRVELAVFGLAVLCRRNGRFPGGSMAGTPAYTSPEQALGEPLDARSDLYSLGVTYYELLTGQRPFRARNTLEMAQAHAQAPVPDPRSVDPSIPAVCADIVRRAMAKQPADRYADAGEMRAALKRAAAQLAEMSQDLA